MFRRLCIFSTTPKLCINVTPREFICNERAFDSSQCFYLRLYTRSYRVSAISYAPHIVYYTRRLLLFLTSPLSPSPPHRRFLLASFSLSYVSSQRITRVSFPASPSARIVVSSLSFVLPYRPFHRYVAPVSSIPYQRCRFRRSHHRTSRSRIKPLSSSPACQHRTIRIYRYSTIVTLPLSPLKQEYVIRWVSSPMMVSPSPIENDTPPDSAAQRTLRAGAICLRHRRLHYQRHPSGVCIVVIPQSLRLSYRRNCITHQRTSGPSRRNISSPAVSSSYHRIRIER